jgi:hypothetical protein
VIISSIVHEQARDGIEVGGCNVLLRLCYRRTSVTGGGNTRRNTSIDGGGTDIVPTVAIRATIVKQYGWRCGVVVVAVVAVSRYRKVLASNTHTYTCPEHQQRKARCQQHAITLLVHDARQQGTCQHARDGTYRNEAHSARTTTM